MNADDTIGLKIGALGTTDARRREGAQDRKGKIILNKKRAADDADQMDFQ
jgi:hypothetical protein